MTPPCQAFPASQLPAKIQQDARGRRRKLDGGARRVDLDACDLLQMLQYNCDVREPASPESTVQCFPARRLFRRCQDRKGSFMVETTAWEGKEEPHQQHRSDGDGSSDGASSKSDDATDRRPTRPLQWSSHWHDGDAAP